MQLPRKAILRGQCGRRLSAATSAIERSPARGTAPNVFCAAFLLPQDTADSSAFASAFDIENLFRVSEFEFRVSLRASHFSVSVVSFQGFSFPPDRSAPVPSRSALYSLPAFQVGQASELARSLPNK